MVAVVALLSEAGLDVAVPAERSARQSASQPSPLYGVAVVALLTARSCSMPLPQTVAISIRQASASSTRRQEIEGVAVVALLSGIGPYRRRIAR